MKIQQTIMTIGLCLGAVACSNEEPRTTPAAGEDGALTMTASISDVLPTRSADGTPVTDGMYYFSYVDVDDTHDYKYRTIEVIFDNSEEGIPWKDKTGAGTQLTWADVNRGSNYFVLDNFPVISEGVDNPTIDFSEDTYKELKEQYKAQPAPDKDGEGNDILWKRLYVSEQVVLDPLHFELKHKMSKLTFEITIFDDVAEDMGSIEGIEVELHHVATTITKFQRLVLTGNVVPDAVDENPIQLTAGVDAQSGENGNLHYTTGGWIFPPQEFVNNEEKPKLRVTLTGSEGTKKVYSGTLPQSMEVSGVTELLSFKEGHHLTVKAGLHNTTDMSINFQPVLVEKWKYQKETDLNIRQAGIWTAAQLMELIDAWNSDGELNEKILRKYGMKSETDETEIMWTFSLYRNITITKDGYVTSNGLNFDSKDGVSFTFNAGTCTVNDHTVKENGTFGTNTDAPEEEPEEEGGKES
ncbi:fimbrillin family protein [Bacteroides gallinarum]|uniref:fimbrillin family protein n=1 Tax=Bacteroides gallinarum TaxID=376806 RepID=UPI0003653C6D|nr:fimbrillin family protein [Bacteroides gallinarum]